MHRAELRSFGSGHGTSMVFQVKSDLIRYCWRAHSVPLVFQLYQRRTLHCSSLYMQQLSDFTRERSKHKKISRSSALDPLQLIALQKLVKMDSVQAVFAEESMQVTKGLQSK